MVLLVLGLCLLTVHLTGGSAGPNQDPVLVWLGGNDILNGLYQVPRASLCRDLSALYHRVGLGALSAGQKITRLQTRTKDWYGGLRLEKQRPPQIIAYPARLDSLLFRAVSINRADKELLCTIPGIGPELAERIVARREEQGGFRQPADLLTVPGIGQAKLDRLQHSVSFD